MGDIPKSRLFSMKEAHPTANLRPHNGRPDPVSISPTPRAYLSLRTIPVASLNHKGCAGPFYLTLPPILPVWGKDPGVLFSLIIKYKIKIKIIK